MCATRADSDHPDDQFCQFPTLWLGKIKMSHVNCGLRMNLFHLPMECCPTGPNFTCSRVGHVLWRHLNWSKLDVFKPSKVGGILILFHLTCYQSIALEEIYNFAIWLVVIG
jgi:hypothetical protein